MSITDELRNWMENAFTYKTVDGDMFHKVNTPWFGWKRDIEEMLDRIDAEHESACAEAYGNGVMSVPIALDESAWVELPKDADGEPIHIGDVMEFSAFEVEKPVTRTVDGIGQGVFFAWCGERGYQQHDSKRYRHHHAPTVEDVLEEFFGKANLPDGTQTRAELIAEYAAKLRLAGEGE